MLAKYIISDPLYPKNHNIFIPVPNYQNYRTLKQQKCIFLQSGSPKLEMDLIGLKPHKMTQGYVSSIGSERESFFFFFFWSFLTSRDCLHFLPHSPFIFRTNTHSDICFHHHISISESRSYAFF